MISLLRALRKKLSPAYLAGFSCPDWFRFLGRNNWQIDPRFLPRAVHVSLWTVATSGIKCFEDRIDLSGVDEQVWQKPVFLLGLPRSGTTHLFNLLAKDDRFGFPTRFDVFNPHTFLTLRKIGLHRMLARQPAVKRPMDNIELGWFSPEEDNIALGILSGSGPRVESIFPKRISYADRFRPVRERTEEERRAFRDALALFTRKLVYAFNRPLLLKSPAHLVYIEEILAVFPEAKFVGIARKPNAQFVSLRHMHLVTAGEDWAVLQNTPNLSNEELLTRIEHHVGAYMKARPLIPSQNLVEIRYEDLVANSLGCLSQIYSGLGLKLPKEFASFETKECYTTNRHNSLEKIFRNDLKQYIGRFTRQVS
jgi:hypothetical protein